MITDCNRAPARRMPALILATALTLTFASTAALAQQRQDGPSVRSRAPLIEAGSTTTVAGRGFEPGQSITLKVDGKTVNAAPISANDKGEFKAEIRVPQGADLGPMPVTVHAGDSDSLSFDVNISRQVPLSGADKFAVADNALPAGLYEVAWGDASKALFVTRTNWSPEGPKSELLKINPATLKVVDSATPPMAPPRKRGHGATGKPGLYSVFGVGADDAHGTVWTTNTSRNTVAVYRQQDLSLARQFDAGTTPHSRDVVVDEANGKAYVSAMGAGAIAVFDTDTLKHVSDIQLGSEDDTFSPMGLTLAGDTGKLYTVNLRAPEVAVIDTARSELLKTLTLDNAHGLMDVAWDAANQQLLVVAKDSDNLLVVDPANGNIEHNTYVGAGALAVVWDPVSGLAYVSTRGGGTIAVVDPETGKLVANLDGGSFPNHLVADGQGHVFAVNKSHGKDDPEGHRILRIQPLAD